MEYLVHYGTKGMHWGERLYQNRDGSLTPLGRARYGIHGGVFDSTSTLASRAKRGLKSVATSAKVAGVVAKGHASRALESGLKKASTSARVNEIIAKGRTARALDRSGVSDAFESTRHAIARGMVAAGNARSSIERLLSTQSAEAERIRAYTDHLRRERTLRASVKSLALQENYARRKSAAKKFVQSMELTKVNIRLGSELRAKARRGVMVEGEISSDNYRYLRTHEGRSPRDAVSAMAKDYSRQVEAFRNSISSNRKNAEYWRRIARGH